MSRLAAPWSLLRDFTLGLRDESRQARPETYHLMRHAYVATRGASRRVLRGIYRAIRPASPSRLQYDAAALEALRREGLVLLPRYLDAARVQALERYFREIPGHPVGKNFARGAPVRIADARGTPRLGFDTLAVLRAPGMAELLADRSLQHLAAAYLGCEPIFTNVNAWWSLADPQADQEALNWAAQLFHFDYDWPAFVKFFFYLTDVGADDGPFTFVLGTHDDKRDWRDGRIADADIAAAYGDRVRRVTGSAGDLIVADTAGYHKGERVRVGPRLMLQLEYCVARLGAGYQYERYPRSARPPSDFRHTFDVFCEPG
jgi:hypothetical protein